MSVIHHIDQYHSKMTPDSRCLMCGDRVMPPCIQWCKVFMCSECCRVNQNGLMADMVQLNAIVELHKLGYDAWTLVRANLVNKEPFEMITVSDTYLDGVRELHPMRPKK